MSQRSAFKLISLIVLLSLLVQPLAAAGKQVDKETRKQDAAAPAAESGLYRTTVTVDSPARHARLEALGVVVLTEDDGRTTIDHGPTTSIVNGPSSVVVLADADQLETLARLRFEPRGSDDLAGLAAAAGAERAWLAESLKLLLTQAGAADLSGFGKPDRSSTQAAEAVSSLHATMKALSPEQMAGLAALPSDDFDGDGLTDTEEAWWCTDPQNANSDGDANGYTDGQEVRTLLDVTQPRNVRWGYGPPFGPPNAWPNFNDRNGTHANVCNDGDWDTIPDYAEVYMVGTRVPEESTDHDKFDDGQELFGITYCPGAPTNCGYGSYPAIEYWNFIQASMPNWVLPPGDNPLVAAFPVPEVYVTPDSWTVQAVTTITDGQGRTVEGTHSYETSVTRGESTGIANTVTWNNWEEVSEAIETPLGASSAAAQAPQDVWNRVWGGVQMVGGAALAVGTVVACGTATAVTIGGAAIPCAPLIAGAAVVGGALVGEGWGDLTDPEKSPENIQNNYYSTSNYNDFSYNPDYYDFSQESYTFLTLNQQLDSQGIVNSLDGVQYAINKQGALLARGLQDVSYQLSRPRYTETRTNGHSWGGSQTTTHEEYEEHTIAEGQAFTTGQNWSTAWAVDSSHAADLTFEFTVKNTGTEYARELTGIVINVYIGDDTSPSISYPAWEKFPGGKLENLFPVGPNTPPGQFSVRTFTTDPIALSLEQMKRIDLGERLTVKVESYSFGADELFYRNAVQGGVTVFIEDGVEDGDESVDSYVIPTWGVESVQDVLTRYFPAGYDAEGNLNALWTPEFDGVNPPTWREHYLSDIAWWNVYLTQADAGDTPLKALPARAGSAILFRFNRDSDRDGYNDRAEFRYYCALPADHPDRPRCADAHLRPEIHPQPEVAAGYVAERSGDVVTVKLAVANTGTFDAYGIDAVMYSPDGTTTIGNNTVGGNGRVRPGHQVAVGSLIKPPDLANWGASTAKPYAGGQFSGAADRTFTFTAETAGVVGQGDTSVRWSDGAGGGGVIPLGSSYHAPLPVDVAQGLQVGFNTGTIMPGTHFTVEALTPRDTFTYTINSEPFTPPVIVVSYSDPQGSRRFVTPVELPRLDAAIPAGQMLEGLKLDIVTPMEFNPNGANTTHLVVNSPHPATIQGGHLYLNFVSDGKLVLEKSYTLDIPAGPTVFFADWSVTEFSADYHPDGDNLLIAFWTDSEGNIIDSAARPLNSFTDDPDPAFAMATADETWDFGPAQQGTLMQHTFTLGSVGYMDLLTYLGTTSGMTVAGPTSRSLAPGDTATYTVTLNMQSLSVGVFDKEIQVRTSDPEHPSKSIAIRGNVTAMPPDAPGGATLRPLDWTLAVPGAHNQGEWYEYTHTLGPDPQTLHPVRVYGQNYGAVWGYGEMASRGSMMLFGGLGADGVLGDMWRYDGANWTSVTWQSDAPPARQDHGMAFDPRRNCIVVFGGKTAMMLLNDTWEYCGGSWSQRSTAHSPSPRRYVEMAYDSARGVIVLHGGKSTGMLTDTWEYDGSDWLPITTTHAPPGHEGGAMVYDPSEDRMVLMTGWQASNCVWTNETWEYDGLDWTYATSAAKWRYHFPMAYDPERHRTILFGGYEHGCGGGGMQATYEYDGQSWTSKSTANFPPTGEGTAAGYSMAYDQAIGNVVLFGRSADTWEYNGQNWRQTAPQHQPPARAFAQFVTTSRDFLVEQIEATPYNHGQLKLPESFTDSRSFQVQYGRLFAFQEPGIQTQYIRMPKQLYTTANLDALVSHTRITAGQIDLRIDVGDDGTLDWTYNNANASFPITLNTTDFAAALNAYMISQTGVAWGADIDVPMKLTINRQADVILTNLVLTLQSNQPGALAAAVEMGADRPLDVPVVITGNHNQGETFDLTHTLGPNADSIHPCKIFDQSGIVLKGVGKNCSDFGAGVVSGAIFGSGQDGDLLVGAGQTVYTDGVRTSLIGSASAGQQVVSVGAVSGFETGREVLIIQTEGTGAGSYEFRNIIGVNSTQSTITVNKNLGYSYSSGGSSKAQVIQVPHYKNVTVQNGGTITAHAWDGSTGGAAAFRASGRTSVELGGQISAAAIGYRGGRVNPSQGQVGQQGESALGEGGYVHPTGSGYAPINRNGIGGGGGDGDYELDKQGACGGGGGYATEGGNGSPSWHWPGQGGATIGEGTLASIFPGGAGGAGGNDNNDTQAGRGGNGGGTILLASGDLVVAGSIKVNGEPGTTGTSCSGGGGGGAGGSLFMKVATANLGTGLITATGGVGGARSGCDSGVAGSGGVGRIRVEYCTSISGSSSPATSTQQINCYTAEQVEQSPYTTTRLYLPDSFTNGQTYLVQYGRRYTFAAAGQATSYLRIKRQVYSAASLDALVSNTGVASGSLDLCLDIGNDGSCDYHPTGSQTFPATLGATGLANALNSYLLAQTGIAWGSNVDVPVRVQVDRQADVMLTNLALTPVGAKTRFLRLPARAYDSVSLGIQFGAASTPAGPLAFTVDVGADGTVDYSYSGTPASYPAAIAVGNAPVTNAFNAYLAGRSGEVDVPVRITPSPSLDTALVSFVAVPVGQADASIGAGDIGFGGAVAAGGSKPLQPSQSPTGMLRGRPAPTAQSTKVDFARVAATSSRPMEPATDPTEGDAITINATIHNPGSLDTGPLTVSFYAVPPNVGGAGGAWYIGSAFVGNVAAAGTATVPLQWNTLGFTGDVTVRVVVDPYNRLTETSETNNETTVNLTIKTRPDLSLDPIALSDAEPVAGKEVAVTLTARNTGQTAAGGSTLALYDGNPDSGGVLICQPTTSVPGGGQVTPSCAWTPPAPGLHRLFARADRDGQVNESNEGNNDRWLDVYVGFGAPVALDSGTPAADPAYTVGLGYGAVDTGQADAVVTCAGYADPTLRRDPTNRVEYRFDHLQPGRFYHLDIVLYECDNSNRIERVLVDEMLVGGPADLGDQAEHRLSIRLDPALYRDHAIDVAVIGADGSQRAAVVASVALREIDYRYADSGGVNDPAYTPERGWGYLDGVAFSGDLPYKSARVDQTDNEVRYRFDRLDPAKRYQLHLNFWQATGNPLLQRIRADGLDTGTTINLVAGTPVSTVIRLSPATYAGDGSVIVSVVVLNANANATINEIALEEETMLAESPCQVVETPSYSLAFGFLTVNGEPAPAGTVVTAESPRGDVVGCYIVDTAGQYGFMPIYGEDAGASPAIPGMRDGELVTFRVDGALAQATPAFYWQNDLTEHQADLTAVPLTGQAILLQANWNLMSLRVEPPVGLVESVLNSISGKYCRVLSETGIYDCNVPAQFRSLKELHASKGYYLRVDGGASANLLVEGVQAAPTTPIALHPGWNWVGYLPGTTLPIGTALASISGAYQRVQSLSQFYDVRYPTFSTLKQLTTGQGYLIYATQAATLIYPAAAAAGDAMVVARSAVCDEAISDNARDCFANGARNDGFACNVTPTPSLTLIFGGLTLNGGPAPVGTRIEALTPRGDVAGCFIVDTPGQYGFMPVYGEDANAAPPIPGFREGESIRLRINGITIIKTGRTWESDRAPHQFDVTADGWSAWLPIIVR